MFSVDLEQFWKDDELAHRNNCFYERATQVALGIRMGDQCVFAELGEEGDIWEPLPLNRRIELNKRYNDKAEKIVGKRLLNEEVIINEERIVGKKLQGTGHISADQRFPKIRRIGEVFEGTYQKGYKTGEWLHSKIETPQQLEKLLDRVEKLDLREFMLPPDWESEKKRIYEKYGRKPGLLRHIRGPVTLATSIYGIENLIYLYYDEPDLYRRFSKTVLSVILEMSRIMDRESGYEDGKAPAGFSFADDNCSLLTAEMYEQFGLPVLKEVFEYYCPDPDDERYQHSDSEMGHLLPLLAKVNLTACNFGPKVLVDEIRKYMPHTRIDGCLAPFTFMNNDQDKIFAEAKRDCEMAKNSGIKGLNLDTAGFLNDGSSLLSMRTVMHVIQNYGRY